MREEKKDYSEYKNSQGFNVGPEYVGRFKENLEKLGQGPNEWFRDQVHELEKEVATSTAHGFNRELARTFEQDVKKLNDATEVINNLFVNQMKALNTKIEAERAILEAKHQKQISEVEDKNIKLTEEIEKAKAEVKETVELNKNLTTENEKLAPANEQLKSSITDKENILKTRDETIQRLNDEINEYQELKKINKSLSNQIEEMKMGANTKENRITELERTIEYNNRLLETEKRDAALQADIGARKEVREELSKQISDLGIENKSLRDSLEQKRNENSDLKSDLSARDFEIKHLNNFVAEQKELVESLKGQLAKAKEQLIKKKSVNVDDDNTDPTLFEYNQS